MTFGNYLSSMTIPELEELKRFCNFSDDELTIFGMLSKGKSITEISCSMKMSVSTINRKISAIKRKVHRVRWSR